MPSGIGIAGNALLGAVLVLCGFAAVFSLPVLVSDRHACLKLFFAAKRAMFAAVALCVAVLILLAVAFLTNDFSIAAVAQYSSRSLGFFYKLSALWAGSAGSLLLWSTALFVVFGLCLAKTAAELHKFNAGVLLVGAAICLVFTAILIFVERPFAFSAMKIDDGVGLNPLLQNFWNIIHPPLLFVGYSALLIPFVFSCVYALVGKTSQIDIYPVLRRWLLLGLCFLTLGIVTGARWSYLELGWGGYWAWDPVENASLLPWLMVLAALHCRVGIRFSDGFRFWTIVLAPVPFILSLVATFITRSGILASVHAFGESAISYPLLVFISCCFVLWLICVARAAKTCPFGIVKPTTALLSKTHILAWAVVVFISTAVIIGAATLWPVVAALHQPTALTRAFYDKIAAAAGILSAFLIGLAALAGIRKRPGFPLRILACTTTGVADVCTQQPTVCTLPGVCNMCFWFARCFQRGVVPNKGRVWPWCRVLPYRPAASGCNRRLFSRAKRRSIAPKGPGAGPGRQISIDIPILRAPAKKRCNAGRATDTFERERLFPHALAPYERLFPHTLAPYEHIWRWPKNIRAGCLHSPF